MGGGLVYDSFIKICNIPFNKRFLSSLLLIQILMIEDYPSRSGTLLKYEFVELGACIRMDLSCGFCTKYMNASEPSELSHFNPSSRSNEIFLPTKVLSNYMDGYQRNYILNALKKNMGKTRSITDNDRLEYVVVLHIYIIVLFHIFTVGSLWIYYLRRRAYIVKQYISLLKTDEHGDKVPKKAIDKQDFVKGTRLPEMVQEKKATALAKCVTSKPAEEKQQLGLLSTYDLRKLGPHISSIGMLYGYRLTGSAFRVGSNKIMTAWHVVRGMLYENNLTQKLDIERLGDTSVFVDFDYEEDYRPDYYLRFPIEPKIVYSNEILDIAVLQLKENTYGTSFPHPLEMFDNFTPEIHAKCPIYLIGHTGAKKKCLDFAMTYWEPFKHRIKELNDWCEKEFNRKHGGGYAGIEDKTRLLFQCKFRHGASGCPGFIVKPGGEARVVTVLLRGFPDFYYFENFTEEEKNRVPTEKLIQQGCTIEAIMKDMKSKNMDLYSEIFHYKDFSS